MRPVPGLAYEADVVFPSWVRGYEHIKLANVERYHERLSQLRADYANTRGS